MIIQIDILLENSYGIFGSDIDIKIMDKVLKWFSFFAVLSLVVARVSHFRQIGSFVEGPMNPYVFFTDEVRLALEKASSKALKGELTDEDARELLEKYDVRRCTIDDGAVLWTIPYHCLPMSVEYIYTFDHPYSDSQVHELDCRPLWGNWYWRKLR